MFVRGLRIWILAMLNEISPIFRASVNDVIDPGRRMNLCELQLNSRSTKDFCSNSGKGSPHGKSQIFLKGVLYTLVIQDPSMRMISGEVIARFWVKVSTVLRP